MPKIHVFSVFSAAFVIIVAISACGSFVLSDSFSSGLGASPPDLSKFKYFTLCEDVNRPALVVWKEYSMKPRYESLADTIAYSFTNLGKDMTFMVYLDKKNMKSEVSSDLVITIKGWQFFVGKEGVWKEVSDAKFDKLLHSNMPAGYWNSNKHIVKDNFTCNTTVINTE